MSVEQPAEQQEQDSILYTRGVASPVFSDGDVIGHTTLLDLDDTDALSVHTLATEIEGLTAVFRSSEGSFHLWDLRVRPFETTIMDALSYRLSDAEHIHQSRLRERYVLRCAPKVFESGERYKSAPELLDVYDDGEGSVSQGHLDLLDGEHRQIDEDRLVGDGTIETHSYMTVTDETKEALR